MTVRELSRALREKRFCCTELVRDTLTDIKRRDQFKSVITLMEDEALQDAARLDRELASGLDDRITTAHVRLSEIQAGNR